MNVVRVQLGLRLIEKGKLNRGRLVEFIRGINIRVSEHKGISLLRIFESMLSKSETVGPEMSIGLAVVIQKAF